MSGRMKIDRERKEAAVSFLIVLLGTFFLPQAMYRGGDGTVFSNSLFSVLVFAGGLLLAKRARLSMDRVPEAEDPSCGSPSRGADPSCGRPSPGRLDRRGLGFSLFFSFFLSLALVFGSRLETVENVDLADPVLWMAVLVLSFYFALFVNGAWGFLHRRWSAAGPRMAADAASEDSISMVSGVSGSGAPVSGVSGSGAPVSGVSGSGAPVSGVSGSGAPVPVVSGKALRRELLLAFVFFLLCWGVVLAAVYPGFFVYDAQDEYIQVATRSFTNHHPLLHVLLLGGSVCLGNKVFGSFNAGIFLYMLFQMLVMAGVFTYVVAFLQRHGCGKWGRRLTVLYFGLFPVIPMYVLCSAKDTLFSAELLLGCLLFYELVLERAVFFKSWKRPAALFLSFSLMILFRHNGLYVLAVFLPFAVWAVCGGKREKQEKIAGEKTGGRKAVGGKTALLLCCALLTALLAGRLLVVCLNASDSENQELLTVPIQQLARTWHYAPETFTEKERETLFEILPEEALARYAPKVSDSVKIAFNNQAYRQDPAEYRKLWLAGLVRKPAIYCNAWLLTSYGFWYPDTVIDVYRGNGVFTFTYEDSSYFGFETEQPGTRESRLPWLNEAYRRLSLEVTQQKLPVLSMLFSPGFLFWLFFFGFMLLCRYGHWRQAAALLPFFLNWGTVLLGPTHLVRYVVVFWFALPAAALMVRNAFREPAAVFQNPDEL